MLYLFLFVRNWTQTNQNRYSNAMLNTHSKGSDGPPRLNPLGTLAASQQCFRLCLWRLSPHSASVLPKQCGVSVPSSLASGWFLFLCVCTDSWSTGGGCIREWHFEASWEGRLFIIIWDAAVPAPLLPWRSIPLGWASPFVVMPEPIISFIEKLSV